MHSSVSKIVYFEVKWFLYKSKHQNPWYFMKIWLYWKNCFVFYMFTHSGIRKKVQKNGDTTSERKKHAMREITRHSEGWLNPERWSSESCYSWSISPRKLLPYASLKNSKKSNMMWHNAKKALTSLKNGWRLQMAIFLFCVITTCWRRKLHLLFPFID